MNVELMEKARVGLQAWQDGDLSALEELLDPDIEPPDYGKREGAHRDPDGNLLRFGSPLRRI